MKWEEAVAALLSNRPVPAHGAASVHGTGLYAWYDSENALAEFYPRGFAHVDRTRPLYVGLAQKDSLSSRIVGTHMVTTRRSTLRRSLLALLTESLDLAPGVVPFPKGKYGLEAAFEDRLTNWMAGHLRVTWIEHPRPGEVESAVVGNLCPPLNDVYAIGSPYRVAMRSLRSGVWAQAVANRLVRHDCVHDSNRHRECPSVKEVLGCPLQLPAHTLPTLVGKRPRSYAAAVIEEPRFSGVLV